GLQCGRIEMELFHLYCPRRAQKVGHDGVIGRNIYRRRHLSQTLRWLAALYALARFANWPDSFHALQQCCHSLCLPHEVPQPSLTPKAYANAVPKALQEPLRNECSATLPSGIPHCTILCNE